MSFPAQAGVANSINSSASFFMTCPSHGPGELRCQAQGGVKKATPATDCTKLVERPLRSCLTAVNAFPPSLSFHQKQDLLLVPRT
jgi:hypothetical protein